MTCPNPRCIGGWLYNTLGSAMAIFPANKKCPNCNPPTYIPAGNDKEICDKCGFLKGSGHGYSCVYEDDRKT